MNEPRRPFEVHCGKCSHEWALGFFPMPLNELAKMSKVTCPVCKSGAVKLGPLAKPTADGDWRAWLHNGDTGISSLTIWSTLSGERNPGSADVPHDPDDFGRCYRLLKVMPEWRERLPEVAKRYKAWRPLVDSWDELTALYEEELPKKKLPKLYARMRELRGES